MKNEQIWGYVRVSTEKQELERQKLEILEYANRKGWVVDRFLQAQVSSRRTEKERGLAELQRAMNEGEVDTVVFSELSRLGRSVGEICRLVSRFVEEGGLSLHFIKESLVLNNGPRDIASKVMLTQFSLLAEIERDLISERTKSALAARKAQGVRLGRPPAVSKLDKHEEEIRGWVDLGVTQKAISRKLACSQNTLGAWLKRNRKKWQAKN